MNKYQNGKIYKIVNLETQKIYVGSTCQTLQDRLQAHKTNKYTRAIQVIQSGNFEIILIEDYPCENKTQLERRERHFIQLLECVNKNLPAPTLEEKKEQQLLYYRQNYDKIREQQKNYYIESNYYENNPEKYNAKDKCPRCQKVVQKAYISRHQLRPACIPII